MAQLTNIRTVSIPSVGKLPLAEKPGSFTPSSTKRDHKAGRLAQDGGFTESSTPAKLELSLNLIAGTDLAKINAVAGEDVTVRLSDGHVHLLSQAFVSEPAAYGDGDSRLVIIANSSEQIS